MSMMTDFDKKLKSYDALLLYKNVKNYAIIARSEPDGRCCGDVRIETMEESPGFIGQSAR